MPSSQARMLSTCLCREFERKVSVILKIYSLPDGEAVFVPKHIVNTKNHY